MIFGMRVAMPLKPRSPKPTFPQSMAYVGGRISPEMQSPRLLWIKENLPETWANAARFFDLSDFLTYRATGNDTRSLCTTVGKWTYQGHQPSMPGAVHSDVDGWDASYWQHIGLEDVVQEGYRRIGTHICPMATPLPNGLTQEAAKGLGLVPGTAVGVSLIDAHSGSLGMIGATDDGAVLPPEVLDERLALICGTSSCHHVMSRSPRFISGVWGPYFSALLPGFWLNEGGQSATGALIDHVIESHPQAVTLNRDADQQGKSVYDLLNERLDNLANTVDFPAQLTQDLHLFPDFHGNRSPYADPTLRGMVSGLTLSQSLDSLALLYLATIQAIACQTRQIISEMNAKGYRINTIFACGGNSKNFVFLREHADITGCRILLPQEPEAVLLGSAILGAVAADEFDSLQTAMAAMTHVGQAIAPATGQVAHYHAAKYAVFQKLYRDQITYRDLMLGIVD
jgi:FGGY-family pentulose kinase